MFYPTTGILENNFFYMVKIALLWNTHYLNLVLQIKT